MAGMPPRRSHSLGSLFRPRAARDPDGKIFTWFLPAVSKDALKKMSAEVRSWRIHLRTGLTLKELARRINTVVLRLRMQYYGAFYHTDLYPLLRRINRYLMRWIRKKYRIRTFKKFHRRWSHPVAETVAAVLRSLEMGPLDLVTKVIGAGVNGRLSRPVLLGARG